MENETQDQAYWKFSTNNNNRFGVFTGEGVIIMDTSITAQANRYIYFPF